MKYLFVALIAVALVAGCTSTQPPAGAGTPADTTVGEATGTRWTVFIRDSGFEPATVNIKPGDTVVWTNEAGRAAWSASNDHPTHTKLPGFDALRAIQTGQSYEYTFTKAGTWGYHDHLKPSTLGTVVVG